MYHIPDEPVPSRWNHLVVDPLWPLLAVMFAGSWLAFPWFAFNGFVMGAHNRYKTLFIASVALAGNIAVILLIAFLVKLLGLPEGIRPYLSVPYILWKLGMAYTLYVMQSSSFEVYKYLDNPVRNGIILVMAGFFLAPKMIFPLFDSPYWLLLAS